MACPPPKLKHQQGPQGLAQVSPARNVLVHQGANSLIVEYALSLQGAFVQQVFHKRAHASAQPLGYRYLEAAFVAVQNFIGQQLGKGLLE